MDMSKWLLVWVITERYPHDIIFAWFDIPLEAESIEATEDIAFVIISSHLNVSSISIVDEPESWENFYLLNQSHLNLWA